MTHSDPDDPVTFPAHSDLTERMSNIISQWEEEGDRRAIFLNCYALMTRNMITGVKKGVFQDNDWVMALIQHFAGYYFNALEAYNKSQDDAPIVWRLTFDAAVEPETMVLQNLLLGINAHINYDLALAVTDLLDPEWTNLSDNQREIRYQDYCYVNEIIAKTIDVVQDQVVERYSPIMDIVDVVLGPLDEWFTSQMINNWRDDVWQHALSMLSSQQADRREKMRQVLEAEALDRAKVMSKG